MLVLPFVKIAFPEQNQLANFALVSRKNKYATQESVTVTDYAAEGKSLARINGKVVFIAGAIPGDVVNIRYTRVKKDWAEARVLELVKPSPERLEPFCKHFGVCGGCKWQMLPYNRQLAYKQQEAFQNLTRIGHLNELNMLPIAGSTQTRHYRNKLEFTFSNKRYLTEAEIASPDNIEQQNALGYHVPRIFDKVIDIETCYLMDNINNTIRNTVRDYVVNRNLSFYDIKAHTGWLRNLIIRHTTTGETMVNLCVHYEDAELAPLLNHLLTTVPEITTLLYTINPKWNDTIYDLTPKIFHGPGYITEKLSDYTFIISPKSFFQTNTLQAEKLYGIAYEFAELTGKETLYDLYCGTGSIGIFMSRGAKKIIGVEVVEEAIEDARKNAEINNIRHAKFFAGDVIDICTNDFFAEHGKPDVVITDPPRAGMHEKLVRKLLEMESPKIVYVSCNTATQARDLALLQEKYTIVKVQPVDMFPHTHHIESVALLTLKH
jgi:23S rRNA (uracil1939-C5)-methyltransferase